MSIINQVLKDIDQRSKEDAKGVRRRAAYSGRPRRVRVWLWVLAGVLSAALVIALLYFIGQYQQASTPLSAEDDMVVQFTPPQLPISEESDTQRDTTAGQVPSSRRQHRAEVRVIDAPSRPVQEDTPEIFSADAVSEMSANDQLSEEEIALTGVTQLAGQNATEQSQSTTQTETEERDAADRSEPPSATPQRELANEFSIQHADPGSSSQPQRLFEQALSDLDAGNARRAAQTLQQVLILAPEYIEAREELAAYYFGRGFISDALDVLEGGLALEPTANSLRLLQARILERIDQPEEALRVIQQAETRLPEDADLLILKGALATELEYYAAAASAYQQLVAWRPDQGRWWIGLAIARENLDDISGALQAYRRAMQDGGLSQSTREFVQDRMEALSF